MSSIDYNEFQAGQGVSAPALNQNFSMTNSALENLEIEIDSMKRTIDSTNNLKANKNGSSAEKFNVADATEENNAVSYKQFQSSIKTAAPIGSVIWFAGASVPEGYLLCDGAEVSREIYAELFNIIGVIYGAGDSTTTFLLPKLIDDRFVKGSISVGVYQDSNIAEHSHNVTYSAAVTSGARYSAGDAGGYALASSKTISTEKSGSGEETYPKNITLLPCIKY